MKSMEIYWFTCGEHLAQWWSLTEYCSRVTFSRLQKSWNTYFKSIAFILPPFLWEGIPGLSNEMACSGLLAFLFKESGHLSNLILSKQAASTSGHHVKLLHTNTYKSFSRNKTWHFTFHEQTQNTQWFRTADKYGNIKEEKKRSKLNFQTQIWMKHWFVNSENIKLLLASIGLEYYSSSLQIWYFCESPVYMLSMRTYKDLDEDWKHIDQTL